MRAETAPEHEYVVNLRLRRVRRGTIKVLARDERLGTGHWTEALALPNLTFNVHLEGEHTQG